MALDKGTLANIDRRVFAELDRSVGTQAVKVPLSTAAWSTWRRYCEAVGLSMGEGVAAMIDHELRSVVREGDFRNGGAVFAARAEEQIAARESQITVRERELTLAEKRMRECQRLLGVREAELRELEQRIRADSSPALRPDETHYKIGRNERCPCRSGLKYKHCHGLAGRQD